MVNSKYHILKEYANGVMDEKGKFFPFRTLVSSTLDLAGKPNIRYFVKSVSISAGEGGAIAAANSYVKTYIQKENCVLASLYLGETFAASTTSSTVQFMVGILADIGAYLDVTLNSTDAVWSCTYAEVQENPGEYNG